MIRQLLLFVFLISSKNLAGQEVKLSNAKPAIMKFYEYIYQDSTKSTPDLDIILDDSRYLAYHFHGIKEQYNADLTQGLTMDKLKIVIANLKIHYDGDINIQYAILKFPNNRKVYFALIADSIYHVNYPAQIYDIYLSNGNSLVDASNNLVDGSYVHKLYLRGLLNTARIKSSLNVHELPDINSVSINEIKINTLFWFTPNDSEWYEIFNYENQKSIGFIRKDYIIMFEDFPQPIKDKILNEGC
jgi:hypothetical protein